MTDDLSGSIFNLENIESFSEKALSIFKFQAVRNPVYSCFITSLGRTSNNVRNINDIPFLPAGFFRSQKVIVENLPVKTVFESSRTTGDAPSRHYVHDLKIYETSFFESFRYFYGDPSGYFIAALIPTYTSRQNLH
jgi:hypothetical protein